MEYHTYSLLSYQRGGGGGEAGDILPIKRDYSLTEQEVVVLLHSQFSDQHVTSYNCTSRYERSEHSSYC